jgi:hypothetical protein
LDKDFNLMQAIADRWGATIAEAAHASSVPAGFLAALTANESAGRPQARRFEPAVYAHLQAVAEGKQAHYGSITAEKITAELYETIEEAAEAQFGWKTQNFHFLHLENLREFPEKENLRDLATSWGLTQIMGYQVIGRQGTTTTLLNPYRHYFIACEILAEFAERYGLDVGAEFPELFRCWNTGRPDGKTFRSDYVSTGMKRLEIWETLQARKVVETGKGKK